jgi:hypothetical protein
MARGRPVAGQLLVEQVGLPRRFRLIRGGQGGLKGLHLGRGLVHSRVGGVKPPLGVRQSTEAVRGRVNYGVGDGPGGHGGLPDEVTG